VLAGIRCGALLQQVLDGAISEEEAQSSYRTFVAADRRRYRGLLGANLLLLGLPQRWLGWAAGRLTQPGLRRWFFAHYLGIFGSPADGALSPLPAGEPS
jgi:hypothetical protein